MAGWEAMAQGVSFGSNGCIVTYEAVEDAMDEGDTGCPICGMAPGWHLTEDQAERGRIDG